MSHNPRLAPSPTTITRTKRFGLDINITDGSYTQTSHYNLYGELGRQSDALFGVKLYRNKAGQITKKIETLQGKKTTYTYRYDARGRLTTVRKNRKIIERYSYDANGNRASADIYGQHFAANYTLDDQLEVYGDNTYRYDDDGYLVEKTAPEGTTRYSYNTLGALTDVTLPGGTQIHYVTDPMNRRIAKEVNGTITEKYLWEDLTTLLAVYDKDDNLVWRFEYSDGRMPVSMTDKGGNRYYLHYDQVGSLRAVSRVLSPDNTIELIKEITYDTYGNIINDSNPSFKVPFGFAGGLYDPDTKLTHFGYREYDAYTGKWMSKDPIGFQGGDSNLYGYVLGDPVDLVDPFGLKPPAHIPPKVDMCKNEKIAREISPLEFYKRVKNFGTWDYKRLNPALYENFGNYHFGYVAAAFGIPKNIAKAGAGAYQIYSNHSKIEWYNSYFDDPKDQKWIDEGYKDYSSDYYNCRCVE